MFQVSLMTHRYHTDPIIHVLTIRAVITANSKHHALPEHTAT
jgi:hypothetical protein